jgi:hypothetical protein
MDGNSGFSIDSDRRYYCQDGGKAARTLRPVFPGREVILKADNHHDSNGRPFLHDFGSVSQSQ